VAFLAAGVPLFLRMPPWCDLTLYEVAAFSITHGGVHYRDVFDTNLPGFVWLLIGLRRAFGPSTEAVRLVDLAIVAAIVTLLARFARRAGANSAGVAWLVAGAALFYPFTTEFSHAQRDVWMLLPVLGATSLRVRRAGGGPQFWPAVGEGLIWGVAVWIKPHVVFPAAAVWLASARRVAGGWKPAFRIDLLGNIAGGLGVGLAGVAWLIATGTWKPFVEVFQKWNGAYTKVMLEILPFRTTIELDYFPPWTLWTPVGALLAVVNLLDAQPPGLAARVGSAIASFLHRITRWFSVSAETDDARFTRGVLAALFLAWALQAMLVQREFQYVHIPEVLLLMALAAANRWALVPLGLAHIVLAGGLWLAADRDQSLAQWMSETSPTWSGQFTYFPRHPLFLPARTVHWPECFRADLSDREYRERMNDVALNSGTFSSIDPVELGEVAAELRRLGAREGEVLCWHDTPHAVYLELGHRPPFRFMHLSTPSIAEAQYERMKIELRRVLATHEPQVRYIVSDLVRDYVGAPPRLKAGMGAAGPDRLPPTLPADHRSTFPFDRPAIFRSGGGHGRYLIHVYDRARPFGPYDNCYFPAWPSE
jgi:hypothetical protein